MPYPICINTFNRSFRHPCRSYVKQRMKRSNDKYITNADLASGTSMQIKHSMHAGNLASVLKTNVPVKCICSIKHMIICSNFTSIPLANVSFGRVRRRQSSINLLSKCQRLNLIHSIHMHHQSSYIVCQ